MIYDQGFLAQPLLHRREIIFHRFYGLGDDIAAFNVFDVDGDRDIVR